MKPSIAVSLRTILLASYSGAVDLTFSSCVSEEQPDVSLLRVLMVLLCFVSALSAIAEPF